MDDIELARAFVTYATIKKQLADLEELIQKAVLEKGESVKLAGITASYYKPAVDVDYEKAARSAMPEDFDLLPYSTIKTVVRWKDVCDVVKADTGLAEFREEKPARVVIK